MAAHPPRDAVSNVGAHPPRSPTNLLRDSITFSLGAFGYKAVALATVPVLARLLQPAGLGLVDLATTIAGLVSVAVGLGFDQAVARHLRDEDGGVIWSSALLGIASASVVAALGTALVFVLGWSPAPQIPPGAISAGVIYGLSVAAFGVALNALRLLRTPQAYAVVTFAVALCEGGIAVGIAAFSRDSVILIVWTWAGVNAVAAGLLLMRLLPALRMPRLDTLRRLAAFGLPLVPASLAWAIADLAVRTHVGSAYGLAAVGVLGIATRVVSVLLLLIAGFSTAWHPAVYAMGRQQLGPRAETVGLGLVVGLGIAGIGVSSLGRELVALAAGPAYSESIAAIAPLSFGALGLGIFTVASAVHGYMATTIRVGVASLIGAAAQVLLVAPAASAWNLAGVGVAVATGYWIAAILVAPAVIRGMSVRSRVLVFLATGTSIAGLVGAWMLGNSEIGGRGAIAAVAAASLAIIWMLRPRDAAR